MPEVTIHENGDSDFPENDIRLAWQFFNVLSESQTSPMKLRPHPNLQSRVFSLDAGHAVAALLRCQVIWHRPVLDTG